MRNSDNPADFRASVPKSLILGAVFFLFLLGSSGCRYYKLEQSLDPLNKEWLNLVDYIITSEERKLFLDLPGAEKAQFKLEFWDRRDPDPNTQENEFKITYEARIESANDMFRSEPRPGYRTDRGRIHVLFGPPQYRTTSNQMGGSVSQEIWYYGNFPVVFVDEDGTGTYRLITYNLTSLRSTNLLYMHDLGRAQAEARETIRADEQMFNFELKIESIQVKPQHIEFQVTIEVPLTSLWFEARGKELVSAWEVHLTVKDDQDTPAWEYRDTHEIRMNEEDLVYDSDDTFKIQIPVSITEGQDRLHRGENRIFAELTEITGSRRLQKTGTFKIEGKHSGYSEY